MSAQAQNALLKTIDEPPEYAVIMLDRECRGFTANDSFQMRYDETS